MKKFLCGLVVSVCFLYVLPAFSAHTRGPGAEYCKDLMIDGRLPKSAHYFSYGYLSALAGSEGVLSRFNVNFKEATDENIEFALNDFCSKNPLSRVYVGVQNIYHQLGGNLVWGRDPDLKR